MADTQPEAPNGVAEVPTAQTAAMDTTSATNDQPKDTAPTNEESKETASAKDEPKETASANDEPKDVAPAQDASADKAEPASDIAMGDAQPATTTASSKKRTAAEAEIEDAAPKEAAASEDSAERGARDNRRERSQDREQRSGPRGGNKEYKKKGPLNDFSNLEESESVDDARVQIEFYFSDSNLPTDKYLFELVGGHKNNPVDLKMIHSFARMRRFQPYSNIVEAVKSSQYLELVNDNQVVRKNPLDEHFTSDVQKNAEILDGVNMPKSIYAKGFPGYLGGRAQAPIEEYFSAYSFDAVRLRRDHNGRFKGSTFVVFKSSEAAKEFLEQETHPPFEWEGKMHELTFKSKKAYCDQKLEDIKNGKITPRPSNGNSFDSHRGDRKSYGRGDNHNQGSRGRGGRGRGRGRYDKGGRGGQGGRGGRDADYKGDKDNWKERRSHEGNQNKRRRDDGDGDAEGDESGNKKSKHQPSDSSNQTKSTEPAAEKMGDGTSKAKPQKNGEKATEGGAPAPETSKVTEAAKSSD